MFSDSEIYIYIHIIYSDNLLTHTHLYTFYFILFYYILFSRLEEVVHTEGTNGRPLLFLVFEYLDYDLKQFMYNKYGKGHAIPETLAKNFCYQILLGLQHCHANSIMHRDLKPQNLLVDVQSSRIKLADFGLGRVFSLPVAKYTHEVVTLWYRAPEILLGTRCYSTAVDIWSVGCIFTEMLLGRSLFCGECELEQLLAIFRIIGTPNNESWPGVKNLKDWHVYPQWSPKNLAEAVKWPHGKTPDHHAIDLIQNMLVLDPAKRLTTMDALRHPYFDDIRGNYPTPLGAHLIHPNNNNKENEIVPMQ